MLRLSAFKRPYREYKCIFQRTKAELKAKPQQTIFAQRQLSTITETAHQQQQQQQQQQQKDTQNQDQGPSPRTQITAFPNTTPGNVYSGNPWDYISDNLDPAKLANGLSENDLLVLIKVVQQIHRSKGAGQTPLSRVLAWINRVKPAEPNNTNNEKSQSIFKPHPSLSTPRLVDRERLVGYLLALEIKKELARGKHVAAKSKGFNRDLSWNRKGDMRGVRVGLVAKAFNRGSAGIMLNVMADWNSGARLISPKFMARIARVYFSTPDQIIHAVKMAQHTFNAGARGMTATGFVNTLMSANCIDESIERLVSLVNDESVPDDVVVPYATEVMKLCFEFNKAPEAYEVFDGCFAVLRSNTVAYNILLKPHAYDCNGQKVASILRMMKRNGAMPDATTWTMLIAGYCSRKFFEKAKKLLSLHLLFLPRHMHNTLNSDDFSPTTVQLDSWLADSSKESSIHPTIESSIRSLAKQYHDEQAGIEVNPKYLARNQPTPSVSPWLPTLITHKVMIKSLGRAKQINELSKYYMYLKQNWDMYSQWANGPGTSNLDKSSGFRGIQRLAKAYLSDSLPELRELEDLGLDSPSPARKFNIEYTKYYDKIFELARTNHHSHAALHRRKPERMTYDITIHGYAKKGDMESIVRDMTRYAPLNSVATWTAVVECICTQIIANPCDNMLLFPRCAPDYIEAQRIPAGAKDWVDMVLELAEVLKSQKVPIQFTQVTYGTIINTLAALSSFNGIIKVISYMKANSAIQLTVETMRMVFPLISTVASKFEFAKLAIAPCAGTGDKSPVVKPNKDLVSCLVMDVKTEDDLEVIREVVDYFETRYAIDIASAEYAHILGMCKSLGRLDLASEWVEHSRDRNVQASYKLECLLGTLAL